jgi:hypothetical protein
MMSFKSLSSAVIGLVAVALVAWSVNSLISGGGPSSSLVKDLAEKDMKAHFKGCVITSIRVIRGGEFPTQGHLGKAPYGTPIYPNVVRAVYTVPAADGSGNQTKEFKRTYFMYKDSSHQWVRDTDLN